MRPVAPDINVDELATSFRTADRPLLWQFLSLYVSDNATHVEIIFHKPALRSAYLLNHAEAITQYYTLHIRLDALYIVINTLWLVVLSLPGTALARSIRKSDYGIRLGGDAFVLILIDSSLAKSRDVIERTQQHLRAVDEENMVAFSWGSYQLTSADTLDSALQKADELLYEHKRNKYPSR